MPDNYNTDITNYIIGDYDNDGEVTASDSQDVLEVYVKLFTGEHIDLTNDQVFLADVDGDCDISAADSQHILMYYTDNTLAKKIVCWDDALKTETEDTNYVNGYYYAPEDNIVTPTSEYGFYKTQDHIEKVSNYTEGEYPEVIRYYVDISDATRRDIYYWTNPYYVQVGKIGDKGATGFCKYNTVDSLYEFYLSYDPNSYELTSEKPGDWQKGYQNYYTYDGVNYIPVPQQINVPEWQPNTYYSKGVYSSQVTNPSTSLYYLDLLQNEVYIYSASYSAFLKAYF